RRGGVSAEKFAEGVELEDAGGGVRERIGHCKLCYRRRPSCFFCGAYAAGFAAGLRSTIPLFSFGRLRSGVDNVTAGLGPRKSCLRLRGHRLSGRAVMAERLHISSF